MVIAHVAAGTSTIRVGAGGIMLPNHAPLVIAEQFGTLAALHPGRIDLGLGRAPGTDMATARALRRNLDASVDGFPQDVVELLGYFAPGSGRPARAGGARRRPGRRRSGSSGRAPMARSSPRCSACPTPSPRISRRPRWSMRSTSTGRASSRREQLDKPHAMLGINVFAAATDEEARLLFSSLQQAFVNLRSGRPGQLPPPVDGFERDARSDGQGRCWGRRCRTAVVGSPETVKRGIDAFVRRTGADELMVTAQIFDHKARVRSFEILADVHRELSKAA